MLFLNIVIRISCSYDKVSLNWVTIVWSQILETRCEPMKQMPEYAHYSNSIAEYKVPDFTCTKAHFMSVNLQKSFLNNIINSV